MLDISRSEYRMPCQRHIDVRVLLQPCDRTHLDPRRSLPERSRTASMPGDAVQSHRCETEQSEKDEGSGAARKGQYWEIAA